MSPEDGVSAAADGDNAIPGSSECPATRAGLRLGTVTTWYEYMYSIVSLESTRVGVSGGSGVGRVGGPRVPCRCRDEPALAVRV